jgi:hypothetical protein
VDAHNIERAEIIVTCKKKVRRIRSFWRDKLFEGGSRSGRIVKEAIARSCSKGAGKLVLTVSSGSV